MEDLKIYSPFYKIRRTLILLRWTLGFPLQATDDSYTKFRFLPWLECLRLLVVCVMLVLPYVYWSLVLLCVDGTVENMSNIIKRTLDTYSTSKLEQVLILFWHVSAIGVSFTYLLLFRYNTNTINSFCNEVTTIKSKIKATLINREEEGRQTHCMIMEKSENLIIYGQTLNVIVSFLWGVWNYNVLIKLPENSIFYKYVSNCQLFYPPIIALQTSFLLFGPISCAAELISCQLINTLSELFKDWTILLQCIHRVLPNHQTNTQQVSITKSSDDLERGEM